MNDWETITEIHSVVDMFCVPYRDDWRVRKRSTGTTMPACRSSPSSSCQPQNQLTAKSAIDRQTF